MFPQDAEGWFYFEGRADDMLKVAGQWVSPAEVEAQLVAHPAVLEAGVVGAATAGGLDRPRACVVLKGGLAPSPRWPPSCASACAARGRLQGAGVRSTFVADLPKTATGKIQRFRLRRP